MKSIFFNYLKSPKDFTLGICLISLIILFDLIVLIKFFVTHYFKALLLLSFIPLFFLLIYIFIIKKKNIKNVTIDLTHSSLFFLNILFFLTIFFAMVSIIIIPTDFFRSALFFILISLTIFILFIELLYFNIEKNVYGLLFQIILILILIRIIPLVFIPGFYSDDPYFHEAFSKSIINNFHIPIDIQYFSYIPFPIMHLLLAITQIITNSTFKIIGTIDLTILQAIIMPLVIFLISRKITNNLKISLIAALIFGFSDIVIGQSLQGPFPTTYAIFLVSLIILNYLNFIFKNDVRYQLIILILTLTLIFSHSLTSLFFTLFIILFYFILLLGGSICNEKFHDLKFMVILTTISVILYWFYSSGFIFDKLIMITFAEDSGVKASFSTSGGIAYANFIPLTEYLLENGGKFIYLGLSLIGLLYVLRKPNESIIRLALILIGIALFCFGGVAFIFALGVAPDRIQYYSYIFLSIPAAIGFVLLSKNLDKFNIILLTILFLFIFLMMVNSTADKDSPIFSPDFTAMRFLDSAERQSIDTIIIYSKKDIDTDNDLSVYIRHMKNYYNADKVNFYLPTNVVNFIGSEIITRASFTKYPIYSKGLYRINYDPNKILEIYGFNHIYNSNTINAYT